MTATLQYTKSNTAEGVEERAKEEEAEDDAEEEEEDGEEEEKGMRGKQRSPERRNRWGEDITTILCFVPSEKRCKKYRRIN
jgi:hypothetical protein